ncbi:MAG: hypothetical protein OHK0022_41220 [Roseiflexaceae bacterium]
MSYSVALGPFHQVWRGPQRILLTVDGERIADLEYRDELNERGIPDRLRRLDLPQALHLVTRTCGTCSFAHALAFCQALEQLAGLPVGPRAAALRCAAAELERMTSHLHAVAEILEAIGMERQSAGLMRLREAGAQTFKQLTGARMMTDLCVPGGVRRDLPAREREELLVALPKQSRALYRFADGLIEQRALLGRTVDVGTLPRTAAEQFGVRGPMARASGMGRDARIDHPYAGYAKLEVRVITQEGGDLYARLVVLLLEALESVKLAEQALQTLPEGDWQGDIPSELRRGQGSGIVEAPRGMLRYTVESDGQRLSQVRIDAPRQLDRLLARTLLSGALLDNVPAIVASCDVCTACAEK